jgi:hypothetical protein
VAALFLTDEEGREAARGVLIKHLEGATLGGSTLHARVTDGASVGVRALDDETLQVRLENPLPYFLDLGSRSNTVGRFSGSERVVTSPTGL